MVFIAILAVVLLTVGIVAVAVLPATAAADPPDAPETPQPPTNSSTHPSIAHDLENSALVPDHDVDTTVAPDTTGERITVIVEAEPGQRQQAIDLLADNGTVETTYRDSIEVTIDRELLQPLADTEAIGFIRSPITPQQTASTSEGVGTIAADHSHNRGMTGTSATIAIIDTGFDPAHEPIASNVVSTRDFTGAGIDDGDTTHGDGTAEIVVDTAPDTDIILIAVENSVQFANAAEWVNNHDDIDVATASLALYGPRNDGRSILDTAIDPGPQSDTAWFISSGNEGDGTHWHGEFSDDGGLEGVHNFGTATNPVDLNCFEASSTFQTILQWNDWDNPSNTYALALYEYNPTEDTFELIGESNNQQHQGAPPVETISYNPFFSGIYCVAIYEGFATETPEFDLFVLTNDPAVELTSTTRERSLTVPATNRYAYAVGAVHWNTETLEPYSSRGPTIDGRLKPELVAPAGVSTDAQGTEAYFGTSAAAPHAAGAAGLVYDANTTATGATLQTRLADTARMPAGETNSYSTTPNSDIGHGLIDVAEALPPAAPTGIEVLNSPLETATHDTLEARIITDETVTEGTAELRVEDSTGTTERVTVTIDSDTASPTVTIPLDELSPGELTLEARIVDNYGWANTAGFTATTTTDLTETTPPAAVTFNNQTSTDGTVIVDEVRLDDGGFVVLHDHETINDDTIGSINGASEYLEPGGHDTVPIELAEPPADEATLIAMAYQDTTATQTFEFVATGGTEDTPYTDVNGGQIFDTALIQFVNETDSPYTPYIGDDGTVNIQRLRLAIDDWRAGDLSISLLRDVIDAWRSGAALV